MWGPVPGIASARIAHGASFLMNTILHEECVSVRAMANRRIGHRLRNHHIE